MSRHDVVAVLGPDGRSASGPTAITVTGERIAAMAALESTGSTLVAMPPLVNSHDHGRGYGLSVAGIADGPLESWIPRLADDSRDQTNLVGNAARQLLGHGVGAAVFCVNPGTPDIGAELEEAYHAAVSAGIRAAVVVPYADTGGRMRGRDDRGDTADLTARLQLFARLPARLPAVDWQLGPVGPQWVTERATSALNEFALEHGVRLHMHLLESPAQRVWADEVYPEGLVHKLDQLGVLGPHIWFAHGTQLRPDEIALLTERGCGLAVNASSNLRLCSGVPPVGQLLHSGMKPGMGLDGLTLNDDGDPWTELRLLRGLVQAHTHESACAADILAMGFQAGAMGPQRPVAIAEGAVADLLIADIGPRARLIGRPGWSVADAVLAAPLRVAALWVDGRAEHDAGAHAPVPLTIGEL
jgi:cytosine/adenosine deaminase-related metal-dependent hydrolase